jgi:integrase
VKLIKYELLSAVTGLKTLKSLRSKGIQTYFAQRLLRGEISRQTTATTDFPVLAYCGPRWGEMAALRVQDFDMLRRRVNVSRAESAPPANCHRSK